MASIYYVYDDLAPVAGSLPLLISRPETRERRRRRWAIAAIFIIDRRRPDTIFVACTIVFFDDEKSIEKNIQGEQYELSFFSEEF